MNRLFVNIKVDREERPDLDRIYQLAHQMLAQPRRRLAAHDVSHARRPAAFFGGTYFPKEARYGMPAFTDLVQRVDRYYREHGEEVRTQNTALAEAFETLYPPLPNAGQRLTDCAAEAGPHVLRGRVRQPLRRFWRRAQISAHHRPRAPAAPLACDRGRRVSPISRRSTWSTLTLKRMGEGGIYDQVGGGFSRYSVDQYWMIPHFEKMLYDNGPLLALYAQTASATGDGISSRDIAGGIANWVLREMQSAEGGYYSSLDADSEGHEGKFYVWDKDEIQKPARSATNTASSSGASGSIEAPNFEGSIGTCTRASRWRRSRAREKRERGRNRRHCSTAAR